MLAKNCSRIRLALPRSSLLAARKDFSAMTSKEARRLERLKLTSQSSSQSRSRNLLLGSSLLLTCAGISYTVYDINENPKGYLGTLYTGSALEKLCNYLYEHTWGRLSEILEPQIDKAIPDWGDPFYGNAYPPGLPAPPLLVLDLEGTLIGSEHTAKYGWRHVKRPGLDKFLEQLRQYYEIVIFSETDVNAQPELLMEVDKENCTHKLGPAAAEMRGTLLLKRLDVLNRDERRILIIDDDRESVQLCERNALIIKPFNDVHDKTDRVLLDLIPLLQAIVQEDLTGSRDIREILDSLGTREAEEAALEYQMRLAKRLREEERKRNVGLGGVLRQGMKPADIHEVITSQSLPRDRVFGMEAKAPLPRPVKRETHMHTQSEVQEEERVVKKKGQLWQAQEEREKALQEVAERKQMAMQEAYLRRMKAKAEEEEAKKKERNNHFS
mmetsp:Transcript_20237/g.20347  ORF Transcript_20237/g.20347 Transcript_20237/m.20347 type:complete len:441 (+) Transcript_20237:167-1489(+)|eukprot:CAMPEP_0182418882 /NCGR_PEP_ID=MMETSP1167-20130531/3260_1 /TAXON_ID=2988 /ORGANISM="Mallomonas Sp, Strain CCMP3275" /LENGTH=440 /DNA_ID=CAMNT_0024593341 /DNA_START=167 /DNA_END=1489 /DNA_ORIENTATION=-